MDLPGNDNVKYMISAQDVSAAAVNSALAGTKRLADGVDSMGSGMESRLASLERSWVGASIAIAAAGAVAMMGWNMAKIGADFEEQRGILSNLGQKYDQTADQIVTAIDRASDNQIAKVDLMKISLGGLSKGLDPRQMTELANAALILGDAAGVSAKTALEDLASALESGKTKSLKPYLGTTLDLETAFGGLESKLTAAEKANAMYNITIMAAADLQARQTKEVDGTSDRIARIEKRYNDATLSVSLFAKTMLVTALDNLNLLGKIEAMGNGIYTLATGKAPPTSESAANPDELEQGRSMRREVSTAEIERLRREAQARVDKEKAEKEARAAKEKADREAEAAIKKMYADDRAGWIKGIEAQTEEYEAGLRARAEALDKGLKEDRERQKKFAEEEIRISESNRKVEIESRKIADDLMVKSVEEREKAMQLIVSYSLAHQTQIYEDAWSGIFEMANNSGDMSQGMGKFAASMKGITDIAAGRDKYTLEADAAYEHYMQMKEMYWADYETRKEVEDAFLNYAVTNDRAISQQRYQVTQSAFGMMAGAAKSFYDQSKGQSEAAFKIYQAMAIGEAVIATYAMATKSYDAMSQIPYVGPALGYAAAAAAIAFGMANVASIASAKPGSASVSTPSSSGGYTYSQPTEASWKPVEKTEQRPLIGNLNVYGSFVGTRDELARELVAPIQKALEDGAH